jgi:hypothetical protein
LIRPLRQLCTTTGVTLQVAKVEGISATEFCANMAKKWQKLTARTGGNLYDKTFIPFGKEGELGDGIMPLIIHQQNQFLKNSKQRIIHNLNDINKIIEISLSDEIGMNMEATGITTI